MCKVYLNDISVEGGFSSSFHQCKARRVQSNSMRFRLRAEIELMPHPRLPSVSLVPFASLTLLASTNIQMTRLASQNDERSLVSLSRLYK